MCNCTNMLLGEAFAKENVSNVFCDYTALFYKRSHYFMIFNLPNQILNVFFSEKQCISMQRAPSGLRMGLCATLMERQVGGQFCSWSLNEPGS